MTTAPTVKFVRGNRTLDLNSGRYSVGMDFAPPVVALSAQYAEGASSNQYGGARLVGTRARNRQWPLSLIVNGNSDAEVGRALRDIQEFLSQAGDEVEPLYLQYKANSDFAHEPLWGQSSLYYEVLAGTIEPSPKYAEGTARARTLPNCKMLLTLKPFAVGRKQRLASALGGIFEDSLCSADGQSRGVIIPEATINKFTNPVFGPATWNSGWTAAASIISAKNTDERFIIREFGPQSARLIRGAGAGNHDFTQSLNVGNTNAHVISCYLKKPDSSAVTASDVSITYGGTQTTTFTLVGNGWYRATASVTGVAGATATGIILNAVGVTVYAVGFQIEEKAYATPLATGDMLGCAWTSTVHASTSSRTAARARIPTANCFCVSQGTVRLAIKMAYANTHANNLALFYVGNGAGSYNVYCRFEFSDDRLYLGDGTNTISSAAQTFSAGDVLILHITWGPAGLAIYKNGVSVASGASYTPPTATDYFFIGTTAAAAGHAGATFIDVTTWDVAMTSTEILNDYANISQLSADGQRIGHVPWLWTKDGDDQVDNCDDSTYDNWSVCGGVPGSYPAITEMRGVLSSGWNIVKQVTISNLMLDSFIKPSGMIFFDCSGTIDATACGGERSTESVSTSYGPFYYHTFSSFDTRAFEALLGKEVYAIVRLLDSSPGTIYMKQCCNLTGLEFSSEEKAFTSNAAFRLFMLKSLLLPSRKMIGLDVLKVCAAVWSLELKRATGGIADVGIDYVALLPRPTMIISASTVHVSIDGCLYNSLEKYAVSFYDSGSDSFPAEIMALDGDVVEVYPDKVNILMSFIGSSAVNPLITYTLTNVVSVTPRWGLL